MKLFFFKITKKKIIDYSFLFLNFFISLSTYYYHSADKSWIFYRDDSRYHNLFGLLGANIAATTIYFFGDCWWIWSLLFFLIIHNKIKNNSFSTIERIISFVSLLLGSSVLCQLYGNDGGAIGYYIYKLFFYSMGSTSLLVFIYAVCISSFIVIFQDYLLNFSLIILKALYSIETFIIHYKVIEKTKHMAQYGLKIILTPFFFWWSILKAWYVGTLFESQSQSQQEKDINISDQIEVKEPIFHEQSKKYSLEKKTVLKKINYHLVDNRTETKKVENYELPQKNLFVAHADGKNTQKEIFIYQAAVLEKKLEHFGIHGKVVAIHHGPVITLFEYEPQIDTKLSKIICLEDDLALALQAMSIRIIAPIPGKSVVGFEVANAIRNDVQLSTILNSNYYANYAGSLPLVLGKDTLGNEVIIDLVRMPHLLVAGSTGSGKSVGLNTMLISLLCKRTPDELQLILIDPKRLEFAPYTDIPHLLFPIVDDVRQVGSLLRWVVLEMERRYKYMSSYNVRNIQDYHKLQSVDTLAYIVLVIDELADLMMTAGKEVEDLITRIAQMARAAGIHMIVATQRPSVDVITGLIKVNFPSRISFRVTSKIDSRTILDSTGAEKLLGRGDMLFLDSHAAQLQRIHGAFMCDEESKKIFNHIRKQRAPQYKTISSELLHAADQKIDSEDEQLLKEIYSYLQAPDIHEISISLLQRKFRIGYNRSARIISILESHGKIMPMQNGKLRKVIKE